MYIIPSGKSMVYHKLQGVMTQNFDSSVHNEFVFIGLNIMYQLLQNVAGYESAAQSFYQTYFTDILQHIFSVVTDSSHTAGMQWQKFLKLL